MKRHCELSPSSSHRWMRCPGSVRLARNVLDLGSSYAREGTLAHHVAEQCLLHNRSPHEFIGSKPLLEDGIDIEVTADMVDHVAVYVNYVRALMLEAIESHIERSFTLAPLKPPAPMDGTADYVCVSRDRTLNVVDLKYGAGVPVEVGGNSQLMYYALGAWVSMGKSIVNIERLVLTVVQPRAPHPAGPIRSVELSFTDLADFWMELRDAAELALAPDAPLQAGSHCRFCPVLAECPETHQKSLALAQREFAVERPLPGTLVPEQVAHALQAVDSYIEDWISALREYAFNELKAGRPIPGYKLVEKRGTRKWVSDQAVEKWLRTKRLVREGHETSLRSVAQMEKALGKSVVIPESLYAKTSTGVTLAAESDPRPAVTAGEEFFTQIEGAK